jgi:hypothetical protein
MLKTQQVALLSLLIIGKTVEDASSSKTFKKRITGNTLRLRQGKIRRGALLDPQNSAFQHLFNSQQDDVLITLCGFDFASFETMHCQFKVLFDNLSPYHSHGRLITKHNKKKGGRHLITSYQCLALVGLELGDHLLFYKLFLV